MKREIYLLAICMALIFSAFTTYQSIQWEIAEGYSIKFTSKNPEGIFQKLEGSINFDENNLEASSFDMTVDAASISTGNGMKNKHAKNKNWFDVEQFPNITFKSSSITKEDDGYTVTGTLTILGVAKEISFPFSFRDQTFIGSFEVNRLDYNLGPTTGMQGNKAAQVLQVDISVPVVQ